MVMEVLALAGSGFFLQHAKEQDKMQVTNNKEVGGIYYLIRNICPFLVVVFFKNMQQMYFLFFLYSFLLSLKK